VVEENLAYYPYGATRINTSVTTPPTDVPYKYTGKELDDSTGLYFYGARYYDATLGRFISADTIVPNPRDPQELNRYTYALNNPLIYTDPTGHFSFNIGKFFRRALGPVGSQIFFTVVAVAAAYFTAGAASSLVETGIFQTAAVTATDQALIGANIVALAPTANAVGAVVGGIAGGAVGGGIAGGLQGGNLNSAVTGAIGGGITGGVFAGMNVLTADWNPAERVIANALRGGTASFLMGGSFEKGLAFAGTASLAAEIYQGYVGYDIDLRSGGRAELKAYGVDAIQDANNWGIATDNSSLLGTGLYEGGPLSKAMNMISGQNAFAGFHDTLTGRMERNWGVPFGFTNVPAALPSLAVTYTGAVHPYSNLVLIEERIRERTRR